MKYLIFIFLAAFYLGSCTSDSSSKGTEDVQESVNGEPSEPVYSNAEEMPRFPGCENEPEKTRSGCAGMKLLKYVRANTKFPEAAKSAGVEKGQAVVGFNIEKDGSITNVEILRDPGHGMAEEAVRIVKTFPNFIPGKEGGEPVIVRYNLPIKFRLN